MKETAIITFGRFNPPHHGHVLFLEKMNSVAKKENADQLVYASHSQDPKTNPLDYYTKLKYLRWSVPHLEKTIVETEAFRPLHILADVYKRGYRRLILFVGGERVDSFEKIIKRYNGLMDRKNAFQFDDFDVVNANIRVQSATQLRKWAVDGDYANFSRNVSQYLNEHDVRSLYNDVRKSMNVRSEETNSFAKTLKRIVEVHR